MEKNRKLLTGFPVIALVVILTVQAAVVKSNAGLTGSLAGANICVNRSEAHALAAAPQEITRESLSGTENDSAAITGVLTKADKVENLTETQKQEGSRRNIELLTEAGTGAVGKNAAVQVSKSGINSAAVNGEPKIIFPGIYYDPEKEILLGPDGLGLLYTGFEYDLKQKIFYSSMNPWQRSFGFMKLYDDAAPLTNMFYDTVRFKFKYNNLDWMIQLWKGQYGITSGAEMGVYQKSPGTLVEKYDCASDDNRLLMSFDLYKSGELYFSREEQLHWWLTGFVLGDIENKNDLALKAAVTLKDETMEQAFIGALCTQGFSEGNNFSVDGLKVSIEW